MRVVVDVQCPDCAHTSRIEYRRLGSPAPCAGCHTETLAHVPAGAAYPNTQWELNFREFLMLVREPASRKSVQRLFHEWFGYQLRDVGNEIQIVDPADQSLDPLAVHLEIQDDSAKQLSLYRTAMSLWR